MTFQEIWDTNRARLFNFIRSQTNDHELAADILQEVSIKLHKALAAGPQIQNHSSWLFQVARNTISDHYRKKTTAEWWTSAFEVENSSAQSCVCDLSGFIIKNYLPEKYNDILYLSDIEQVPQKEIASRMGLSVTATKSRIQRGRAKLKQLILQCVDIEWNSRNEPTDFRVKPNCQLPEELLEEIERINLSV